MRDRNAIRVGLLTEAGHSRGYGHLGRCAAMYDALDEIGAEPELVVNGVAADHITEERRTRNADWLDSENLRTLLGRYDAAVVDSYEADSSEYELVATTVRASAYFDDTIRLTYPSGLLVNGSPGATRAAYPSQVSSQLLLGPEYQPLRRPFWNAPSREAVSDRIERALVVFGGTGVGGLQDVVASYLERAEPQVDVDVVDTRRTAAEMRDSMVRVDVAISAAGQTLYELACTGTPAIAFCVAENQRAQAHAWAEAGALTLAEPPADGDVCEELARCMDLLRPVDVRERMSRVGSSLCDGSGGLRVAEALVRQVEATR